MTDQFREAEATFSLLARKIQGKEDLPAGVRRFPETAPHQGRRGALLGHRRAKRQVVRLRERRVDRGQAALPDGEEGDLHLLRLRERHRGRILRPLRQPARRGPAPETAADGGPAGVRRRRRGDPPPHPPAEITVRSLDVMSFLWFFGVFGLFAGIVFGLLAGVTGLFSGFVSRLPGFFVDHQGDLLGGLATSRSSGASWGSRSARPRAR